MLQFIIYLCFWEFVILFQLSSFYWQQTELTMRLGKVKMSQVKERQTKNFLIKMLCLIYSKGVSDVSDISNVSNFVSKPWYQNAVLSLFKSYIRCIKCIKFQNLSIKVLFLLCSKEIIAVGEDAACRLSHHSNPIFGLQVTLLLAQWSSIMINEPLSINFHQWSSINDLPNLNHKL